ncbi:hypothetical protein AAF712_014744 [Marasmius tenuissimus]|uniref:Uncharacterized protein n=1 Tax=Marasmius tenuissimus TaxID=585030 RepID=A0ABR2ZAH0_9AGAR
MLAQQIPQDQHNYLIFTFCARGLISAISTITPYPSRDPTMEGQDHPDRPRSQALPEDDRHHPATQEMQTPATPISTLQLVTRHPWLERTHRTESAQGMIPTSVLGQRWQMAQALAGDPRQSDTASTIPSTHLFYRPLVEGQTEQVHTCNLSWPPASMSHPNVQFPVNNNSLDSTSRTLAPILNAFNHTFGNSVLQIVTAMESLLHSIQSSNQNNIVLQDLLQQALDTREQGSDATVPVVSQTHPPSVRPPSVRGTAAPQPQYGYTLFGSPLFLQRFSVPPPTPSHHTPSVAHFSVPPPTPCLPPPPVPYSSYPLSMVTAHPHQRVYLLIEVALGHVTNALASIKKALELIGKDTFAAWEPNVLDAILQIGLIGHIRAADDTRDTSFATRPIIAPDEPSAESSNEHIKEFGRYMANDSAVLQILRLRISDNIHTSLPSANDRGLSRTARELYAAIKRQYGLGNSTVFKTSRDSLYAMMVDDMSKVLSYTENYQKQAMTLAQANDDLDWSDMIHHFAACLPDSPVISNLKYRLINMIATQHCNVDTLNESTKAITNQMVTWSSNKNPKKSQNGDVNGGANGGAEERN